MPEGRSNFENGYGPPGVFTLRYGLSADPVSDHNRISQCMGARLPVRQISVLQSTYYKTNQRSPSISMPVRQSHFPKHLGVIHKLFGVPNNIYQSRTRLPVNQSYQQRDLRHGGQGSVTITNPIMEE